MLCRPSTSGAERSEVEAGLPDHSRYDGGGTAGLQPNVKRAGQDGRSAPSARHPGQRQHHPHQVGLPREIELFAELLEQKAHGIGLASCGRSNGPYALPGGQGDRYVALRRCQPQERGHPRRSQAEARPCTRAVSFCGGGIGYPRHRFLRRGNRTPSGYGAACPICRLMVAAHS